MICFRQCTESNYLARVTAPEVANTAAFTIIQVSTRRFARVEKDCQKSIVDKASKEADEVRELLEVERVEGSDIRFLEI